MSRISVALTFCFLLSPSAQAKDRHKPILPPDILHAETAFVTIHPDAGEPLTEPTANRQAREAVEKALEQWGRFRLVQDSITADLIFTVRTGNGKIAQPTVKGSPGDDPSVIVQPSDGGDIRIGGKIGGKIGRPPDLSQPTTQDTSPRLSTEVGPADDTLEVYRGRREGTPLDSPPVWRYTSRNSLRPPAVSAVEQFQKAIAETEKAASQNSAPSKR